MNEDGDFLIGGINGDIPSSSAEGAASSGPNNVDYLSSLLGSVDYYNSPASSAGGGPPASTAAAVSSSNSINDNGGLSTYEQQYGATTTTTNTRIPGTSPPQPSSPPAAATAPLPRSLSSTSTILGLNEDGDFLIDGINDDRSSQTLQGGEGVGGMSLLSALSTSATSSPPSSSSTTDINLETLLAGSGLVSSSSSTSGSSSVAQAAYEYEDRSSSSGSRGGGIDFDIDVDKVELMEEFIRELLPSSVSKDEVRRYAISLHTQVGFDPDCFSSSYDYLQYEDLTELVQMKVLHARYFWKEWTELLQQ